jgi:ribonuclease-3
LIGVRVKAASSELEKALGYGFQSRELLVRALTHRSLANEQAPENGEKAPADAQDNERLEFLGDAVLGLVVAEALFESHPEWHEGELTRVRSRLVSRQHMAEVARAVELGSHLRMSRGEERNGLRNKGTVLSNGMEAVLGAMFLDGGLEPVKAFAGRWVMGEAVLRLAEELRSGAALGNHKSALQEYLQAERAGSPLYRVKSESGPDHRKRFEVEVRLRATETDLGRTLARGTGSTKKIAEQDAARRAMERLRAAAANGLTGAKPDEKQGAEDGAGDEEQAAE